MPPLTISLSIQKLIMPYDLIALRSHFPFLFVQLWSSKVLLYECQCHHHGAAAWGWDLIVIVRESRETKTGIWENEREEIKEETSRPASDPGPQAITAHIPLLREHVALKDDVEIHELYRDMLSKYQSCLLKRKSFCFILCYWYRCSWNLTIVDFKGPWLNWSQWVYKEKRSYF